MVSDELYERTCLYGCFQSEDELERSEDLNDSKPNKKKKKRSGSLQGKATFVHKIRKMHSFMKNTWIAKLGKSKEVFACLRPKQISMVTRQVTVWTPAHPVIFGWYKFSLFGHCKKI